MGTTITGLSAAAAFILFILISLILFLKLPNGFAKFFCASISIAAACMAYWLLPRFDFILFVFCATAAAFYLMARVGDFMTRNEGGCFLKRQDGKKPRYFRFF